MNHERSSVSAPTFRPPLVGGMRIVLYGHDGKRLDEFDLRETHHKSEQSLEESCLLAHNLFLRMMQMMDTAWRAAES